MGFKRVKKNMAYCEGGTPIAPMPEIPFQIKRAPTTTDQASFGTIVGNKLNSNLYICDGTTNGSTKWIQLVAAGGDAVFHGVTVSTVFSFVNGVTIGTGAGVPATTPPNGSMYLRTDGDENSTIYMRVGGAWATVNGTL